MARLFTKQEQTIRRVSSVEISKHDGSLILSLVRAGSNSFGWAWNSERSDFDLVEYAEPRPKTKRITIHTSGRVNYHDVPNPGVNFIPCLLDLAEAVPIAGYVIPSVEALDIESNLRAGDHLIELPNEPLGSICFLFYAIPSLAPQLAGEVWRFMVEERYGLACALLPGSMFPVQEGVPKDTFSVFRWSSPLQQQSIQEDISFIRFQKLMHANQVRHAINSSAIPAHEHGKIIDDIVRQGRGVQGPTREGVWEIVCNVPMRIRPTLEVQFSDPRYRAEMLNITSTDRRLEKVRVRFRVYDNIDRKWVKHPVGIVKVFLHAEL